MVRSADVSSLVIGGEFVFVEGPQRHGSGYPGGEQVGVPYESESSTQVDRSFKY